jgi:hypothetical protein
MPHQGVLFIPTYSRTEPRIYFGLVDTPPDELAMSDRVVRFKMRAAGEYKIGVRAAVTTGSMVTFIQPARNMPLSSVIVWSIPCWCGECGGMTSSEIRSEIATKIAAKNYVVGYAHRTLNAVRFDFHEAGF